MIYFVGTDAAIRLYLPCWGTSIAHRVAAITYENLIRRKKLPSGAYIFQEIDRLSQLEAEQVSSIWDRLQSSGGNRLLNHPTRCMRRYELLRTLKERGTNRFDVYRATEARWPVIFPVFIREADEHTGNI